MPALGAAEYPLRALLRQEVPTRDASSPEDLRKPRHGIRQGTRAASAGGWRGGTWELGYTVRPALAKPARSIRGRWRRARTAPIPPRGRGPPIRTAAIGGWQNRLRPRLTGRPERSPRQSTARLCGKPGAQTRGPDFPLGRRAPSAARRWSSSGTAFLRRAGRCLHCSPPSVFS